MGRRTIRLGSAISFDEEKEADIINKVEDMLSRHKLGDFISNLLRLALDSTNKLSKDKLDESLKDLARYGMSPDRYKFFGEVSKSIEEMKLKVDAMYDMNLKLLTLAQMGKHMGLEPKTNNSLMAQFVLEQQLNELSTKLGITHATHVFSSNKIQDTQQKSGEILAYIIETYDNIVSELQQNIFKEIELKVRAVEGVAISAPVQAVETKPEVKEQPKELITPKDNVVSIFDDPADDDSEIVDFGNADMNALDSFFGGN